MRHELIYQGKSIEAQAQIRAGANVNLRGNTGWTPLMFAAPWLPPLAVRQREHGAPLDQRWVTS